MNGYYFQRPMYKNCGIYFTVAPNFWNDESLETDEKYPLLSTIENLRESAADYLRERGFTEEDFFLAARHVRRTIYGVLDAIVTGPDEKNRAKFQVGGLTKPNENYREWMHASYLMGIINLGEDALLRGLSTFNEASRQLEWADIMLTATIWCMDEATFHLNNNQPYKAGVWVAQGLECLNDADAFENEFSRKGTEKRHETNRAVKKRGLEIYASQKWSSQADAARKIATKVNRTSDVVERWIRDYKKGVVLPGE